MGSSTERAKKAMKAMEAMKPLGFSGKQVKAALKQLLKIFGNNWELIEDEGYRALIDAICEGQEPKSTAGSQQEIQATHHGSEPPGATTGDDRHHPPSASKHLMDDDDADDHNEAPLVKRPRKGATDFGQESDPVPRNSTVSTQCVVPASPQTTRRQTGSLTLTQKGIDRGAPSGTTDALFLKDPKPEPEIDVPQGSDCRDVLAGPDSRQLNTGSSSTQDASFVELDVASSTMGEVKMSLKCNLDPSKFSISMEEVFKMVEEKCLHSYKMLPPGFSIGKLMNEVCQSVVQLGTMHSGSCSNGDSLEKGADAPFVKPISYRTVVDGNGNAAGGSSVLESSELSLQNSVVAWKPEMALCKRRAIHDVTDISKGEERVRISIVNDFGSETCPPSFYYIPRNVVFQNAYVNISIARIGDEDCCADCSGNCLSASLPCACARATGGEFAYTPEGLVRTAFLDECISINHFPEKHHRFYCKPCPLERSKDQASSGPCKGHLARKFIKECWSKCGCGMQCGNRVIQHGITCKLQVFFTNQGKGWGLRTLEDLPKGAFICEFAGEVLTSAELYERTLQSARNGKHMHQVLLDADWATKGMLRDEEALSLDATFYGNAGRFVNHRCYDSNLVQIPVEVETPDHHYYHLALFTTKKVEAFEELTWDYGIDFDDVDNPNKAFRCMCGSRYCRDPKNPGRRGKAAARGN